MDPEKEEEEEEEIEREREKREDFRLFFDGRWVIFPSKSKHAFPRMKPRLRSFNLVFI